MQSQQTASIDLVNPILEFMEFNFNTIESLYYFNPFDFKLNYSNNLDKNMRMMIDHSHKMLDYMYDVFLINKSQVIQPFNYEKTPRFSRNMLDSSLSSSQRINETPKKPKRKTSIKNTTKNRKAS